MENDSRHRDDRQGGRVSTKEFGSHAVRLDARDWRLVGIVVAVVLLLAPWVAKRLEGFDPQGAYRVPYAFSEDYWLFERWAQQSVASADVLIVGDSVVWGEYVRPDETLPASLDAATTDRRFANLGVNGIHPAALEGLLSHHGSAMADGKVLLCLNLLWMTSPRQDLQDPDGGEFNHAALVSQWWPSIPAYDASASERIGTALERRVPFWSWVRHLRVACFDGQDVPHWTIEHPNESVVDRLKLEVPPPSAEPRRPGGSWRDRGMRVQSFDWVDLDASIQWRAFRGCVDGLIERGCDVCVLVGPFNAHLLDAAGRDAWNVRRDAARGWLESRGVEHVAPEPLPSEQYADASHPLAVGYAELARRLVDDDVFRSWLSR